MAAAQRIQQINGHLQPPAIGKQSLAGQVAIVTGGARGELPTIPPQTEQTRLTNESFQESVNQPLNCLQQMGLES
jgi:hypothetical protein